MNGSFFLQNLKGALCSKAKGYKMTSAQKLNLLRNVYFQMQLAKFKQHKIRKLDISGKVKLSDFETDECCGTFNKLVDENDLTSDLRS